MWYQSLVDQWVDWKLDFVKLDCVLKGNESVTHEKDIVSISESMADVPSHEFVLSICPVTNTNVTNASAVHHIANSVSMARVTADFWDSWSSMYQAPNITTHDKDHFDVARDLAHTGRNASGSPFYIDLDILPFGRIGHPSGACTPHGPGCPRQSRFTLAEQRTIMTLWTMVGSPLIMGGDLRNISSSSKEIMLNHDVLAAGEDINEFASEIQRASSTGGAVDHIVWLGQTNNPLICYLAVFNVHNATILATVPLKLFPSEICGLQTDSGVLRDLWSHKQTQWHLYQDLVLNISAHDVKYLQILPK